MVAWGFVVRRFVLVVIVSGPSLRSGQFDHWIWKAAVLVKAYSGQQDQIVRQDSDIVVACFALVVVNSVTQHAVAGFECCRL